MEQASSRVKAQVAKSKAPALWMQQVLNSAKLTTFQRTLRRHSGTSRNCWGTRPSRPWNIPKTTTTQPPNTACSGTAKPVPELGMHFWAKKMDEDVAKSSTWNLPRGLLLDPLLCYICWTPNELFAIEAYICEVLSFTVCNIWVSVSSVLCLKNS